MDTFSPLCILDCPCDKAVAWTKAQLSQVDLRMLQTFNLNTAPTRCQIIGVRVTVQMNVIAS